MHAAGQIAWWTRCAWCGMGGTFHKRRGTHANPPRWWREQGAPGGLDVLQEVAPRLGGRVRDDVAAGDQGRQVVVLRLRQVAPHDHNLRAQGRP